MHGNQRKLFSVLCSTWIGVLKLCEFFSRFGINYRSCSCKRKLTEWASHNLKNRYWYIKFKLACSLRTFCNLFFILAFCSLYKTSARLQDQDTTLWAQNFGTHLRGWREFKKMFWTFCKSYDISEYHYRPFKIKSYFQNCKTTNTIDQTIQSSYMFTCWLMHSHQKVTH